MTDLDNYYRLVGYLRANGLDEAQANATAEETFEQYIFRHHRRSNHEDRNDRWILHDDHNDDDEIV